MFKYNNMQRIFRNIIAVLTILTIIGSIYLVIKYNLYLIVTIFIITFFLIKESLKDDRFY